MYSIKTHDMTKLKQSPLQESTELPVIEGWLTRPFWKLIKLSLNNIAGVFVKVYKRNVYCIHVVFKKI